MANKTYTQAEIGQAGYAIESPTLTVFRDKLILTLVDLTNSKRKVSAYLDKKLLPAGELQAIPLPKDYVIKYVDKGSEKESYFVVGEPVTPHVRKNTPVTIKGALPAVPGDNIHLKSVMGTYLLIYASVDLLIITCKTWAKQYIAGERMYPNEIRNWDDFKCLEGGTN